MKRTSFKITLVIMTALFVCASCFPIDGEAEAAETLRVHWQETAIDWFPGKAILEHTMPDGCGSLLEIIPSHEDANGWTELIFIGRLAKRCGGYSLSKWFKLKKKEQEEICPGASEWQIIEKKKNRLLFEHRTKNCAGHPDQVRIGIIVDGDATRWEVEYNLRQENMPEPKRGKIISSFSKSEILK
jgi:hypothetical protein